MGLLNDVLAYAQFVVLVLILVSIGGVHDRLSWLCQFFGRWEAEQDEINLQRQKDETREKLHA